MTVRKSNPRAPAIRAPEGRASSTDALPEVHLSAPQPSALGAEFRDKIGHNLTNRPRIFIQTGTGTIAGLFEFVSFLHRS